MSQATSANSSIKTFKASAAINPGHTVDLSAAGTVTESSGANTAVGVYIGAAACGIGDYVEVCILGPCRAWCESVVTVGPNTALSNDASGHVVIEATTKKRVLGYCLEPMASGTGYIEILVAPSVMCA